MSVYSLESSSKYHQITLVTGQVLYVTFVTLGNTAPHCKGNYRSYT